LALAVAGAALALLTVPARRLPRRIWGILVVLLALLGEVIPLWQFALLRPLVAALYNQPLGLGWGPVAFVVGSKLLLALGILAVVCPDVGVPDA